MLRNFIDTMTPIERAKAISKGENVDRLQCNPNIANGVARFYGCKISDFNNNPKILADAQIKSFKMFGYDSVRVFTDLFPWAEAMGAKVKYYEDNTADLEIPAIDDIKDIDKISIADPFKDGRLPIHLEAMKYLVNEVGNEVSCSAGLVGPFTNSCFLIGVEKLLKLTKKNPIAVHKLCRLSLESLKRYVDAVISIGIGPTISEPMSSSTVISPSVFNEFSQPYLYELVRYINNKDKPVTMHICGQTKQIWNNIADLGVQGFSIDNVADLKECKNTIGTRVRILGNVDPSTIMYLGTPDDVRIETLKCIRDAYDSPKGFTIMSGCSLPTETPAENISAMLDVTREVGYPINVERVDWLIQKYSDKLVVSK